MYKALFLLTLLAGGSTAIYYNVNPRWEELRTYYNPPQVFGQLDEEHGWKTTVIYGEPVFEDCKQRTYGVVENNSLYSSYSSNYNDLYESPSLQYEPLFQPQKNSLYSWELSDPYFPTLDSIHQTDYTRSLVIPNGSFYDYSEWPEY